MGLRLGLNGHGKKRRGSRWDIPWELRWGRLKVIHVPFRYQNRGKEGQSRTKDVAANLNQVRLDDSERDIRS